MGLPRVPVPYGQIPGCQLTSRFKVLCSALWGAASKGPCPLTPTTATLWMLPEDMLKQYENYCNRKVSIHCDRRYEMMRGEFYVSIRKRTFVSTKMVAARCNILPRLGEWGAAVTATQMPSETRRPQEGHRLVSSCSGAMAPLSARFCQNGSDRGSSRIRQDVVIHWVGVQELINQSSSRQLT